MLHYLLRAVHGGAANGEHEAANSGTTTQWHEHVNAWLSSAYCYNIKRLEADALAAFFDQVRHARVPLRAANDLL